MSRELQYFQIGSAYGGRQDWFTDPVMRIGGCAAAAACDACLYFALRRGKVHLYPYERDRLSREDYLRFSGVMKRYLRPRLGGVTRLELFTAGLGRYFRETGETALRMDTLPGGREADEGAQWVRRQIDGGYPVPFLLLRHRDQAFKGYVWHWFLLTGYRLEAGRLQVKAVTYGGWRWLDLYALWDTGYRRKGGLILFTEDADGGGHG